MHLKVYTSHIQKNDDDLIAAVGSGRICRGKRPITAPAPPQPHPNPTKTDTEGAGGCEEAAVARGRGVKSEEMQICVAGGPSRPRVVRAGIASPAPPQRLPSALRANATISRGLGTVGGRGMAGRARGAAISPDLASAEIALF